MLPFFRDRAEAGRALGEHLADLEGRTDTIVLALPRGGVPVGFEVAQRLRAPFDVFIVRKLGVPGQEELAMGAIASGGVQVLNQDVVEGLGIPAYVIDEAASRELEELARREHSYRDDRPPPDVRAKTVVLVDDGLATGSTMRAAVKALRMQAPAHVIVAVPTGSREACALLERETDRVVCLTMPEPFRGVGAWYENFSQTTDEVVRDLLQEAQADAPS